MNESPNRSISLYGCGVVSPISVSDLCASSQNSKPLGVAHLNAFLGAMWTNRSALRPSKAFHGNSLVGEAAFDFEIYRSWITERVNEKRFMLLQKSAGECVKFAIGACVDALESNPGLDALIRANPHRVTTLIGSGLGDLSSICTAKDELERAQFVWDAFWGKKAAESALAEGVLPDGFVNPHDDLHCSDEWLVLHAKRALYSYFANKNSVLKEFLQEYEGIESAPLRTSETSLINQLKSKSTQRLLLRKKYGSPIPPWESVSSNVLWNIPNLPAAQISMLLGTHGLTASLSGACSTFALALRAGIDEINLGRADIALVGATDGNPRPEILAAFHGARVGAYGRSPVFPLTDLRGTHLAGGACVWVLCSDEFAENAGLQSMGVKIRGVAVTSDAEHVITPSLDGPSYAVRQALSQANVDSKKIQSWDLHCTGTPGDTQELEQVKAFVGEDALISARKGLFGHGMAVCGGWELTAQLLAPRQTASGFTLPPSGVCPDKVSPAVAEKSMRLLLDQPMDVASDSNGSLWTAKLNMGVGGVSSCVICERVVKEP